MGRRLAIYLVTVSALLVAAAPAAARPDAHAAACEKRVTFALVDARTSGCLTQTSTSPDTWESTDLVNLNGIPLQAFRGTKLVLKGPSSASPGGSVGVGTKITFLGYTVFDGSFDYQFPAGGAGDLKTLTTLNAPSDMKIKGFAVGGSISVMMGKDNTGEQQGYSRFELILKLPDIFRNGPNQGAGSLTGTVAIRADAAGVHADTLKIEVANAYIGQVLLKSVCISYVSASSPATPCSPPKFGAMQLLECKTTGADRWDGSALIQLPTADKPEVGVFAGTSNGSFAYAGAQVTNLGKSAPLAPGVYLDKVGIAICLNPSPMKIRGSVGIRFGPDFNGGSAAYLNGSVTYTDSRPWVLQATGSLSLFDKQVASGYFTYKSDGAIDFGFSVSWSFYGVLDLDAGVQGWYQPARDYDSQQLILNNPLDRQRFANYISCILRPNLPFFGVKGCSDAERAAVTAELDKVPRRTVHIHESTKFDVFGSGKVCAIKIVCTSGQVAVSSVGAAGCARVWVAGYPEPYKWGVRWVDVYVEAGAGYKWGDGSHVDVMGSSCDVGPYRATKSSVAAAAGGVTVRLSRAPAVALKITGLGKPPNVSLTGPTGEQIVADAAGQLKRNKYYYLEDPQTNATSFTIVDPAPGTWTIRTLPGSSPIVNISQAPVSPDPVAVGQVSGSGSGRIFTYAAETAPGLAMTFWERGANYEQQLGSANGATCFKNEPVQGHRPAVYFMAHPRIVCGEIPFAPAPGPAGVRNIVAVVTDNGEPVREFTVTTYRAGGEALPSRPTNLRLTRRGSTVTITWGSSAGAADYDLDINLSDGSKVLDVRGSRQRHVVLRGIDRRLGVSVTVTPLRSDNVPGPSASASLKGG